VGAWRREGLCMYLHEENVCSCFGEGDGHGLPNTSGATCDESRLALERVELLYGRHCVCYSSDAGDWEDVASSDSRRMVCLAQNDMKTRS